MHSRGDGLLAAVEPFEQRQRARPDKSMECSSNETARRQAVEALKVWGTACMVGVNGKIEFNVEETIRKMIGKGVFVVD